MTTSVETAERFVRQLGIYNPDERSDSVTFVGIGGIGSFAAYAAAKLGVGSITLIDPDVVESHNVPNQLYDDTMIGDDKVVAMESMILCLNAGTNVEVWPVSLPDPDVLNLSGVVVSGLDSMEARIDVWNHYIRLKPSVELYLDARISGEFIVVYAVNPTSMDDVRAYEMTLHSDDEGEAVSCTERGIIDVGFQVAAMTTRLLRRHFDRKDVPRINMMNQESFMPTSGDWIEAQS